MKKNRPGSVVVTITLDEALHAKAKEIAAEVSAYLKVTIPTCRILDQALELGLPGARARFGLTEKEAVPKKIVAAAISKRSGKRKKKCPAKLPAKEVVE
jgi:hypothetical protein